MQRPELGIGTVTSCLVAVALVVSLPRSTARACSIDQCQPSVTLPFDGSSMPANVPGFLWRKSPDLDPATDPDYALQLHAIDESGTTVEMPIETVERRRLLQIRPLAELTAGTQLVFSYLQPRCGRLAEERVTIAIQVTEPRELPPSLGQLRTREGTGMIQVASGAGDCDRVILAGYADVTLELAPTAEPFAGVLRYELRVDGERAWMFHDVSYATSVERRLGASSLGPGKDRLYTPCTAQPRLSAMPELDEGRHSVRMVGILPDDTVIESEEVTVDLRCDGPAISPQPNGAPRDDEAPLRAAETGCSSVSTLPRAAPVTPCAWIVLLLLAAACLRRSRTRCSRVRHRLGSAPGTSDQNASAFSGAPRRAARETW